jgi:Rod binding domain-containing protein
MNALDAVASPTELSLGNANGQAKKADEAAALRSFEAYFLGEMLRIAAPQDSSGPMDGGQAGQMYRENFHQELARLIADHGGVGLAKALEGQLQKKGAGADGEAASGGAGPALANALEGLRR